jgi:predicted metal-binding protein
MKGEQIECFDLVSDPDFSVFKCRNYGFAFSCPRPDWLTLSKLYKGFKAWRDMLIEFTNETERWLRDYHTCSIAESVSSTMSG